MLTIEFFQHLAPGKPYGCILYAPLDAPDDWYDQYEAWQFDKTGKVPPPPGYEGLGYGGGAQGSGAGATTCRGVDLQTQRRIDATGSGWVRCGWKPRLVKHCI